MSGLPKKPNPPSPPSAGRIPALIGAKKGTRVIAGKTHDIPKVDLVRSLFKGSDADRAALRSVWENLDADQKQELAVAMANEMPSANRQSGPISIEGKEILEFMRGKELPPERLDVLRQDHESGLKDRIETKEDIDRFDEEADGTPESISIEEPLDDVRPEMSRRKLPDGISPRDIGLKDPNTGKEGNASSKLSQETPLRAERKTVVIEVPGPDGKPVKQAVTEVDGRFSDQDMARVRKAEGGKPVRDNDMEREATYTDPDTGASGRGFVGRSAADMTERAPAAVYNDTVRQVLEGTRGADDRIDRLYQMLRDNPDNPAFHADPRAAFQDPRQMAEVLWRNADQTSFLEARNPVSPLDRRSLSADIKTDTQANRYLGLPDTTMGQATRWAQESGLPVNNNQLRARAEQDILDQLEKEIAHRYGGSGWGRKYDEAGNLTDPGVGAANDVSDAPAVSSRQERVPDEPADQGLWKPDIDDPAYDIVDEIHRSWDRHRTQERVSRGLAESRGVPPLPMDNPAVKGSSGRAGDGGGSRTDVRTPEEIAADNKKKIEIGRGRREIAANDFNRGQKNQQGEGVIQTRREASEVQAEIDKRLFEGAYPEDIPELIEELRQAKILDGLVWKPGKGVFGAKSDPTDLGTDDAPAVSTRGRKGQTVDPHKSDKDRVRKLAEEARDRASRAGQDPNAQLQEAASGDIDNPESPDYIPPVNQMGEPDGFGVDGYPEPGDPRMAPPAEQPVDPGTGLIPAGTARGTDGPSFRPAPEEAMPHELALDSSASPIDADPIPPRSPDDDVIDAEFEVRPDPAPTPDPAPATLPEPPRSPDPSPTPDPTPAPGPAPGPGKPREPMTTWGRTKQVAKLGGGALIATLVGRSLLGLGDRGGLSQPLGNGLNAGEDGMMGGGQFPGAEGGGSFEGMGLPTGGYAEHLSPSERIRIMQQMNGLRANPNAQTAQNWRY